MISRKHRFHGYGSLRFVYSTGRQVRTSHTSVKFAVNSRRQTYRVAVVVSKKVSKSAVVRNRIRRRMYELVRESEPNITQPYDIVITVFNEAIATMPTAQLARSLAHQLTQAGITAK